ncbi:helix-turn-helix transcriptional regulator [Streptomyces sp. NPDC050636]|uniref:helix-turn-helix transcriptional regulator n=1 Tax=Streptomyces sp. NPDC050636 TaxID=3154510 RepID=UPI003433B7E4
MMTPIDCLTPAEIRATAHVALGLTSGEIAIKLRLARGTVDGQLRHAQYKLGVNSRTVLIHRCYAREQLPRPDRIKSSQEADAAEVELLQFLALGASHAEMEQRNSHGLSQHGAKARIKALRERWGAKNDPHLITRAWEFGVLDESQPKDGALWLRGTPAVLR